MFICNAGIFSQCAAIDYFNYYVFRQQKGFSLSVVIELQGLIVQECIPVGCVPPASVAASAGGGICPRGVYPGGCLPVRCLPAGYTPPPSIASCDTPSRLLTESQTGVKSLPSRNFVCGQ